MKKLDYDLKEIHARARNHFSRVSANYKEERDQCIADMRFYFLPGAQWEEENLASQYENKPKLEVNKTHLSIIKIINEYRNNRISVKFVPKKGIKDDTLADTLNGLFRADEADSCADEAYDNAFEEAVGGGFGAFRLTNQYEDEYDLDEDQQRILFEPIYEAASSVYFDLNAKKQDKSDAKWAFVIKSYTYDDYELEFDDSPSTWPKDIRSQDDWFTNDRVYVAEYYEVEEESVKVEFWERLGGEVETYTEEDFERNQDLRQELESTSAKLVREKKAKQRKIHKYLLSGSQVLEDLGYIPGGCIPIVPVYGKRLFINNIERCQGHVRLAKDPQRIKNMQVSKLAEISALSSVEKPILTPEQIGEHADMWNDDNIKNYPFLLINSLTDKEGNDIAAAPAGYTRVPNIPPALAASIQISDVDIKEILGNLQQNEEISNNISGKALRIRNERIDMQTFIYLSNFAKSLKRAGEIWLGMAKELYVEDDREMKIISEQEEVSSVRLQQPYRNPETFKTEYRNDISRAKMGVTVSVGPSSESKRSATVEALTNMMTFTQDPETLNVISAMAMMNMEGEGIEDVRKFFRNKLLMLGAVTPTEDEARELAKMAEANKQPDANEQLLISASEEAQAKAQKAKADTMLQIAKVEETKAKTEETRAKTIETLSEIESKDKQALIRETMPNQATQQPGTDQR